MNRLSEEKSPYLLQHQHNPVHWWSWSAEAIEHAKQNDKPIFLSVGYSTCYWCHVMERESFEDEDVAKLLNEDFVCIKVDREERPDIDAIYMEAVLAINGHGGWPLSVFLSPDLKPFFGGTYFPKDGLIEVLKKLSGTWKGDREKIEVASRQLYDVLQVTSRSTKANELDSELWKVAFARYQETFDSQYAGFGEAPKFPASGALRFLLRYYRRFNEEEALHMARKTMEQMALGGMYDQIGGGFHRYSTDAQWLVPHFEKMLYDTAQMVPAYLECWQLSGEALFKEVAKDSLDYVLREMRSDQGGFYSAQDAGAVGREGEFYVWTQSELEDLLSAEEFALVQQLFDISPAGNFESNFCILRLKADSSWEQRFSDEARALSKKLLEIRNNRRRPHVDDKVLSSWNALMISALCKGYQCLNTEPYLAAAQEAARFIRNTLYNKGELFRRYRDGETRYPAYLEDYAFLIQALLDLYQSDHDYSWLQWAKELQAKADSLFWDAEEGGYFAFAGSDPSVLVQKKEHSDSALPSASAVSVSNLFRLSYLTASAAYEEHARAALAAYSGFMKQYPSAFAYTFLALEYDHFGPLEVLVSAKADTSLVNEVSRLVFEQFQPTLVLACGGEERPEILANREKGAAFVCAAGSCSAALGSAEALSSELRRRLTQ